MKQIIVLGTPWVFMIISAVVIKYTYDYRLKRKIIESIGVDDITLEIFKSETDKLRYLRLGLVFVGLGLGIYISYFLEYNIYQPVFYSFPCILIGIGFIVSCFVRKG